MTEAKKKIRYSRGPLWLRILVVSLAFLLSAFPGWIVFRKSSQRLTVCLSAIAALLLVLWLGLEQRYEQASAQPPSTTDNPIDQFTVGANLQIYGNDIPSPSGKIGITNIDLNECAAQCNSKEPCVAFSFDRWTKVCYLKNKVVAPLLDPPSLTAVKKGAIPNKSNEPFEIQPLYNRRFSGQPSRHARVSNFPACTSACRDDENCVAFSFLKDAGTADNCQIFRDPNQGHIADPSTDSGYKSQIPSVAAQAELKAAPERELRRVFPNAAPERELRELRRELNVAPGRESGELRLGPKAAPEREEGDLRREPRRLAPKAAPEIAAPKAAPEIAAPSAAPNLRELAAPKATPNDALPQFPWPPPAASGSYVLPDNLLQNSRTVREAVTAIISALEFNGYVERSFFQTETGGVALVTRLERINDDGSSVVGSQRWSAIAEHAGSTAELINFLRGLFFIDPGHYRVIVFILQDLPFSQSSRTISKDEASAWLRSGFNILPSSIAERPYAPGGHCTVLVYEFASDGRTVHVITSGLTGKQHLEKAGVLSRLGNVN
jgi:PAN domain